MIGADRRVMGIALAIEPLQEWGGFFVCTERFIPMVLGGSSPLRLDPGQLCICTCTPCLESVKAEVGRIEQLFSGLVAVGRCQEGCRFSISSDQQRDRGEIRPTPDRY